MTAPVVQDGIRPSAMPRVMDCAGSDQAMATMPPQEDNEHTELGKKRHEGMALMLRMGPVAGATKLAQEQSWTAEDIAVTGTAYNLAKDILANYDNEYLAVEHEVDVSFLGVRAGERRIDVAGYNPLTRTALVLDWKFGTTGTADPERNWQLLTYAPGWVAELLKKGLPVDAVELVIVQPRAYRKDDQCRAHTMPIAEVRANALKVLNAVKLARTENAPRTPTDTACQFCTFKPKCPEYQGVVKQASAKKKTDRLDLVASGTGIVVVEDEKFPFTLPLVVISQELVQKVDDLVAQAMAIKVTDLATAEEAGRLSKELRKLNTAVDTNRKEVKAPVLFYGKQIDEAPKAVTTKLTAADDYLQAEGRDFLARELEKAAEAERQRQVLEAAKAKAEEERLKAERARKPENQAAAAEAAAIAEAQVEELTAQGAAEVYVPVMSFTGFKAAPTISLVIDDIGKVPPVFARQILVVDAKKVAQMLKDGLLVEENTKGWATILRGTAARRT